MSSIKTVVDGVLYDRTKSQLFAKESVITDSSEWALTNDTIVLIYHYKTTKGNFFVVKETCKRSFFRGISKPIETDFYSVSEDTARRKYERILKGDILGEGEVLVSYEEIFGPVEEG